MRTTTEDSSAETVQAPNIYPAVPMKLVTQAFVKAVQKPNEGGNTCLQDFLAVMDKLTKNSSSFSFKDVLFRSQCLDLSAIELRDFFEKWTAQMMKFGKLEQAGCQIYDEPVFILT